MEKLKLQTDKIFVVGTDTGVGKTVLSLLLMQFFYANDYIPFYIKPIQTGCSDPYDKNSDAKFIYKHVGQLTKKDPADSIVYCFREPKAPYFASHNEGKNIDLRTIQNALYKKSRIYSPVIMEAAGGLLVPVNEETLMIDLIKITGAKPIIAARAGLGTINHTLLTIEALHKRDIQPGGIVFIDTGEKPAPQDMISENIEAVESYSGIKVAGVIGKIKDFLNPGKKCYQPIERVLTIIHAQTSLRRDHATNCITYSFFSYACHTLLC
ncbi:MAG: dethiobiotin synthase [Desulfobacteraceae bacterium]|nr:dethiobiotin synthase [Desulfobacteraceae bacterium]MBC2718083.1 dethiobiotin synthase [Desulfobacteraceae bacterium]